uniref:ATP synthase complex subunit 8 n=1 Tax=Parvotettix domesticus TaxID=3073458 RepID=A0AAU7BAE5_9ORTH
MPQMAPMNWLIMFLVFSVTMILFSLINYFMMKVLNPSKSQNNNNKSKSMNWTW